MDIKIDFFYNNNIEWGYQHLTMRFSIKKKDQMLTLVWEMQELRVRSINQITLTNNQGELLWKVIQKEVLELKRYLYFYQ